MAKGNDLTADMNDMTGGAAVDEEGIANEDVGLISKPFDPEKIRVKTEPRSLDLVLKRIKHGEIDLAPEFQRRARVWPQKKKAQLIESLLLRIPLPVFYVSAASNDDWAVVDGLQRLTTISDFAENVFPLTNLEYLNDMEGMTFAQLPRALQRRIEETVIVIHIIEPGTPDDVMINIFKRINTGGEPLRAQEIRNALVKGPAREFLKELAACAHFLDATGRTVKDTRLDAQECVARFCTFFIHPFSDYGDSDLDSFILKGMQAISAMPSEMRHDLRRSFEHAMDAAAAILGRYAFRKFFEVDGRRGPVSKALFEATSVNLARLSNDEINRLTARKDKVLLELVLMMGDEDFLASITSSTGDRLRVHKRFSAIKNLLGQVLT
ncbi:DUF262 domain-containing protein [Rhodomicrobium sp.]|uniref:DUF262 domain-containing protein n=1 Tax=Rhodomicrobium sp. TaxID=2720632 RepID=UPI0039E2519C